MKIALAVSTFYPHLGGMGQVVYDEARALAKLGHEVSVYTLRYPGFAESEELDGFSIKRLKPIWQMGDAGVVQVSASDLKDFDIIHLHFPWFGGVEAFCRAAKINGQKYLLTYHMEAKPKGLFKKILKWGYDVALTPKILNDAKLVAVVDQDYFSTTRWSKLIKAPVEVLANPVDTNIFSRQAADWSEFNLLDLTGKKVILFVGNLLPLKRLDLIFDALKTRLVDTHLVVAGSGYAEGYYKQLVGQMKIGERVHFLGSVTERAKLARLYNLVDCLVIPSDTESFSLTALESLASETPVVGSAVGGLLARVSENQDGFLFKPGSSAALAEAVIKVFHLSRSERQKFGEFGASQTKQKFGLNEHVKKLLTLYQAL